MAEVEKYGCEHYKRKCALIVRECYINVMSRISSVCCSLVILYFFLRLHAAIRLIPVECATTTKRIMSL